MNVKLLQTWLVVCCTMTLLPGHILGNQEDAPREETAMRLIGHRLLLASGDSTGLVLPVRRKAQTYKISAANPFALEPDTLVKVVSEVLANADINGNYLVEVVDRNRQFEVVYSFMRRGNRERDLIPCSGRVLPPASYEIRISFSEWANSLVFWSEGLRFEPESEKQGNELVFTIFFLAIFFIAGGAFYFYWNSKKRTPMQPTESGLLALGSLQFDAARRILINSKEKINLTDREADLLLLLVHRINQPIAREEILKEVWGDEGHYIGRTLDVFISRLRKKLESEPGIQIVTIRGMGYKLELNKL